MRKNHEHEKNWEKEKSLLKNFAVIKNETQHFITKLPFRFWIISFWIIEHENSKWTFCASCKQRRLVDPDIIQLFFMGWTDLKDVLVL